MATIRDMVRKQIETSANAVKMKKVKGPAGVSSSFKIQGLNASQAKMLESGLPRELKGYEFGDNVSSDPNDFEVYVNLGDKSVAEADAALEKAIKKLLKNKVEKASVETAAGKIVVNVIKLAAVDGASASYKITNIDDLDDFSDFDLSSPIQKAVSSYGKLDGAEAGEFYVALKKGADATKASEALEKALISNLKKMLGARFGVVKLKKSNETASVETAAGARKPTGALEPGELVHSTTLNKLARQLAKAFNAKTTGFSGRQRTGYQILLNPAQGDNKAVKAKFVELSRELGVKVSSVTVLNARGRTRVNFMATAIKKPVNKVASGKPAAANSTAIVKKISSTLFNGPGKIRSKVSAKQISWSYVGQPGRNLVDSSGMQAALKTLKSEGLVKASVKTMWFGLDDEDNPTVTVIR